MILNSDSLHANQPNRLPASAPHSVIYVHSASPTFFSNSQQPISKQLASRQLATVEATHPQPVEPLPINLVSVGGSRIGLAIVAGTFGLLLTLLWLRICRLNASLQRRDQRIRSLLAIDPLTALSNRDSLCQRGEQLLSAHSSSEIALLSLNLDQFKAINEGFGHQIGDELLRQVGYRIKSCMGSQDILARMGNDEFSLLLAPEQPEAGADHSVWLARDRAKNVAEKILDAIHRPFRIQAHAIGQTHTIHVDASLGIAMAKPFLARSVSAGVRKRASNACTARHAADEDAQLSFSQLLSQTHAAIVQVKQAKARRRQSSHRSYLFFQPVMAVRQVAAARLRQDIQRALSQDELCVRYQPIVDLETAKTVGFEALVRWQHPTLGLLSPNYFLPIAEEIGLIVDIDRWVMEIACQLLLEWQTQQLDATMSVNLSGSHLGRSDLVSAVQALLLRYPIDPSRLNLEVTEGVMIAEPKKAIATLTQLREMGLNVSLDDFGTGYCSFSYLQQFPVDILKIDQSFISGLLPAEQAPSQDNIIVESLLSLSERMGIRVVAEGIECADQYHQLQAMRCAYGQGNFFAEPMTDELACKRLAQDKKADKCPSPSESGPAVCSSLHS